MSAVLSAILQSELVELEANVRALSRNSQAYPGDLEDGVSALAVGDPSVDILLQVQPLMTTEYLSSQRQTFLEAASLSMSMNE